MNELKNENILNRIEKLERRISFLQRNQLAITFAVVAYIVYGYVPLYTLGGILLMIVILAVLLSLAGAVGYILKTIFPGIKGM